MEEESRCMRVRKVTRVRVEVTSGGEGKQEVDVEVAKIRSK